VPFRQIFNLTKSRVSGGSGIFCKGGGGIETTFAKIQRTTRPKASAITKRSAVNCGGVWGTPKLPLKILVMNRLL
jgi:hypothetical protein